MKAFFVLLLTVTAVLGQQSFFYPYVVDFNNPNLPNDDSKCIRNATNNQLDCSLTLTTAQTYPDGVSKLSFAINGFTPGPAIHCILDDYVIINAANHLETETTSLHWHGLLQRNNSVWMDGVSYVTQFPMPPMVTYTYKIYASETGTQWYHSHAGPQYADGLFGALIIHDPDDPNNVYPEFVVLMNEWQHKSGVQIVTDLEEDVYDEYFPSWVSGLINGNGRYSCSEQCDVPECIPNHNYSVFVVGTNNTYRFRVIGSTAGSTLIFGIDNHTLTVVAVDGVNVEPVTVDRVYVYVAQRYDVLVTFNQTPANYWMRANTMASEFSSEEEVLAIIHYDAPLVPLPANNGSAAFEPTSTRWGQNSTFLNLFGPPLIPLEGDPPPTATRTVNINFGCSNHSYYCDVNSTQFRIPSYPAAFATYQHQNITSSGIYIDIEYGEVIMLVIDNLGNMSHPFHLHGHQFYVLGNGVEGAGNFSENDNSQLNWVNPVLRDTQQIQAISWMVLLFTADNPGVWFFHCHIEWHMIAGLALVFRESSSLMGAPPSDMPYFTTYGATLDTADVKSATSGMNSEGKLVLTKGAFAAIFFGIFIGGTIFAFAVASMTRQRRTREMFTLSSSDGL